MTDGDGFLRLPVSEVDRGGDDSVLVTFDRDGRRIDFLHGQHLTLRHVFDGVEVRRSYSICSPAPDGPLRVGIRHVPGGALSSWAMSSIEPGTTIDVLPPTGHFTHDLDPASARRYTLFAAGSGITPVYSIAATILAQEPRATVELFFLNRTSRSAMLLDDLHELRDRFLGRARFTFAFTREAQHGELLSGRPDRQRLAALVAAGLIPADVDHAFLCGPFDLVTQVGDVLEAAGLPPESIHRELFGGAQLGHARIAPQAVDGASVAIASGRATLHGRTSAFEVYEGDTVLDAVQRVRPDAPYSCRSGVCSTCQAVLRTGEVSMDVNYGLTTDEVGRGYVLTCQSHPLTDTIEVDYDA